MTQEPPVGTHDFDAALEDYDASSGYRARFWLLYLRLGLSVLAFEGAATVAYFALTAARHNRVVLISIASSSILVSCLGLFWTQQISVSRWRQLIAIGFILFAEIALSLAASLDGGFESPVIYLLVLPILFGALAATPK